MNMNDMVLVSVDDHMVEPPGLFDNHIPAKYKDDVPKLIQREDGTDAWVFEGAEATNVGLNAVAGRPPDEYGAEPTKLSEIREGCYNIDERIGDMNADGVAAALNHKITHGNALRLYNFDMFSHIPKEQLTVGALRAQATDVDLGFRSSERLKKEGTDTVTVLDLASKIAT